MFSHLQLEVLAQLRLHSAKKHRSVLPVPVELTSVLPPEETSEVPRRHSPRVASRARKPVEQVRCLIDDWPV